MRWDLSCSSSKEIDRVRGLKLIIIVLAVSVFALGCFSEGSDDSDYNPNPVPEPEQSNLKHLLKLTFQIDPRENTVKLETGPGEDADSIGTIRAMLYANPFTGEQFVFEDRLVVIFVRLEGSAIKKDLVSSTLRITDLGSDSVVPSDIDFIIPGLETLMGVKSAAGYDENGMPYYDYGDFYSTKRAMIYNDGQASYWDWFLCFDLGGRRRKVIIQGQVTARLPSDHSRSARITIQPYLNNLTPNSVSILWETNKESRSDIYYGLNSSCSKSKTGTISRYLYHKPDSLNPPSFSSNLHKVTLTKLKPGMVYYYQVRSAEKPSPVYTFKTLSDQAQAFRFGVLGDTRTDDFAHSTVINQMLLYDYDFLIHLGDFQDNFSSRALRINFFEIEQPLLSFYSIFPVRGNHDDLLWYQEYFKLPKHQPTELPKSFYSFNYQGTYFIILDTDVSLLPGTTAYNWLTQELARAQADPQRNFTFLFSHQPFYSGYAHFYGVDALSYLAPLFRQYDVSAGFAGHVHLYERLDVSGKPFFISGGGGAPPFYTCEPDQLLLDMEEASSGEIITEQRYGCYYEFLIILVGPGYFQASAYDWNGLLIDNIIYYK